MNRVQIQVKVKQLVHGMIHEKQEASPLELLGGRQGEDRGIMRVWKDLRMFGE